MDFFPGLSTLPAISAMEKEKRKKRDVSVDPWDGKIDQSSQLFFDSHKQLIF